MQQPTTTVDVQTAQAGRVHNLRTTLRVDPPSPDDIFSGPSVHTRPTNPPPSAKSRILRHHGARASYSMSSLISTFSGAARRRSSATACHCRTRSVITASTGQLTNFCIDSSVLTVQTAARLPASWICVIVSLVAASSSRIR